MNKLKFAVISFFLWAPFADAALPPLWQCAREIEAILNDEQFGQCLSSADVIEEIKKEDNRYYIHGSKNSCRVEVIYLPREDGRVGPAAFKLIFHKD